MTKEVVEPKGNYVFSLSYDGSQYWLICNVGLVL